MLELSRRFRVRRYRRLAEAMNLHKELPLQKMGKYPQALEARIIEIAKSNKGKFAVTPRYRDYAIQQMCKQMKKKGILKQIRYGVFESYELIKKT